MEYTNSVRIQEYIIEFTSYITAVISANKIVLVVGCLTNK